MSGSAGGDEDDCVRIIGCRKSDKPSKFGGVTFAYFSLALVFLIMSVAVNQRRTLFIVIGISRGVY